MGKGKKMELVRYDAARKALQECVNVDEAKTIADKSYALQTYAKQAKNPELERMAAEIRLRAKRKVGEISAELETDKPGPKDTSQAREVTSKTETLKEAGISKSEAHRCEQLAAVPESEFESYIVKINEAGRVVSSDEAIKRVTKKVKRAEKIDELNAKNAALPEGKSYNVIYADPPWRYSNVVSEDRRLENHYPTMSLEDICAMPVEGIAADDAGLYLWATVTELPGALRVMSAWGFEYRSHAVWVKPSIGIGFWFRARHELLLLGVRGKFPTPIEADRHSSVFEAPTGAHSEKPAIVRDMIDKAYGDLLRIELFAREESPGWDVWGNQSAA
jgi:N6-adenosine-specific RNA methylase IME4